MARTCVICGGDEASGEQLLEAPCQRHWVCTDDVASFFERATENESLYPPKCCGQLFLLGVYEAHIPFEVSWNFQMKAQGEYSVLAKYRVYCANPACSKFISPAAQTKDPSSNTNYAICQDESCGRLTCTTCKTLLDGASSHNCEQNEDYRKFKQTATEKGFQECPTCASTVELAEACNHITCQCGASFCYVCGENWPGVHGCPPYGPAVYDVEGYNQDGFHRNTGLNREGRTRQEQARADHAEDGDPEDENDNEGDEEGEQFDEFHPVLQHVEAGVRAAFAALTHEEREMFLVNLQIELFEERGITFGNPEEGDENDDGDDEEGDGSLESDDGERDDDLGQASDNEGMIEVEQGNGAERGQNTNDNWPSFTDMTSDDRGNDDESSPATSQDENQPSTPMDVDSVDGQQEEEQEPYWKGPPGGWSSDEGL
ncbi:IBR finger domain-containing protein [Stagonosporopsis vannaccii]|nr:IBR finger domain-containing protein [Stagonosporopsis vannaccii]